MTFARKPGSPFSSFATPKTRMKRAEMKKRARKRKPGDDTRLRWACHDEPCYLRIAGVCIGGTDSTVPAHRNEGKGMGLKTPDEFTVPACMACHREYDQGKRFVRDEKRAMWNAAFERWKPARDLKLWGETMRAIDGIEEVECG